MRSLQPILTLTLSLVLWLCLPTVAAAQDFSALQGTWGFERDEETHLYERWQLVNDSTWAGTNYVVGASFAATNEQLRLLRFGAHWVLLTAPKNQAPTAFWYDAAASKAAYFVFRNPEHDFPTRIVYDLRQPDVLTAWVADDLPEGEGKRVTFRFERMEE